MIRNHFPAEAADKQQRLAGKIAVVTGCGAGIGKGCAMMFARQGATVVGCDLIASTAEATVAEAKALGLNMLAFAPCDLTDPAAVEKLFDFVAKQCGGVDILLNAAATAVFKPIEEMTFQDWRTTLAAELDSVFLTCKAAWPLMVARGGGSIINFASANAYLVLEGSPALAHCAGKGGILAMTRQLALEGGSHGIRANTLSPGMIVTAATSPVLKAPGFIENVLAHAILKRVGQPEDIAWAATFLASDESSWITAADLNIDGGATAL
jgi:NAD(P)-dependent dehydrogenase (short-subunit alcohol dehydrogenase family)